MMDATKFQTLANDFLQKLADRLEVNETYDVDYLQGILSISTPFGDYIVNRHEPTRQIWFSSPTSGGAKFSYDENLGEWVKHDGMKFNELLASELKV